jgi:apolipoprotein D and lipocalin family protein
MSWTARGWHHPAMNHVVRLAALIITCLVAGGLFAGCARSTAALPVAEPFDQARYLGVWYEQVRYDHSFERGLEAVSATYAAGEDGRITVTNRGWNAEQARWSEASGYAVPAGSPTVGHLRVTFFWPFFGDYRIVHLDPEYRTAFITGPDYSWFWILTRERDLDEEAVEVLIQRAIGMGFERAKMLRVRHDRAPR